MREIDLLIIGAGPTGLGAAHRAESLGLDYLVVEAGDTPGGLATSVHQDGYTWDLGGHVLHSHFPEFDKAIADAGVDMVPARRNGWALIGDLLIRTPVQRQLDRLPTDLHPDAPAFNLGDYYRNHFGRELAERFFIPFQEKMWATPVQLIDHEWTSLRNGSAERNVPTLGLKADEPAEPVPSYFPYPAGGTGALWDALGAPVEHRIEYSTRVAAVIPANREVILGSGEHVRYRQCVSSMPLPSLCKMVDLPRFPDLRANSVTLVGVGFKGEPPDQLADKSWLYCPDRDVAWQRATMLSNYHASNAPDGCWSVLFECGFSAPFRGMTEVKAFQDVMTSLRHLGAPSTPDVIFTRTLSTGYPVPTLGRDTTLHLLDRRLIEMGIRSRGRFGGWRYESCNSDYSFMQGWQAVDAFIDGSEEDVYWKPEDYS